MGLFGGRSIDPQALQLLNGFAPAQAALNPGPLSPVQGLTPDMMQKPKRSLFGGMVDPESPMTGSQRLQMLGATLRDTGAGLNGQNSEAVATLQLLMQNQQKAAQARQEAIRKQQEQAKLYEMADGLGMDAREKVLFLANPNEWAKANASRFEAYTLAPGSKRGVAGQQVDYAPQNIEMGDQLVQTAPDGSASPVFTRDPTFSESTTAKKIAAEIDNAAQRLGIDRAQLAEMVRSHRAGEGIAAGNLGVRRDEYNARLKGIGGFGTPGVGAGFVPDADVEVNP